MTEVDDREQERYLRALEDARKLDGLRDFSFESDAQQPHLATALCNLCADAWDVKLPLGKGAFNTLRLHKENKHGPPGTFAGEIRKKGWRSRMERKVDNIAAMVSYLPGVER